MITEDRGKLPMPNKRRTESLRGDNRPEADRKEGRNDVPYCDRIGWKVNLHQLN